MKEMENGRMTEQCAVCGQVRPCDCQLKPGGRFTEMAERDQGVLPCIECGNGVVEFSVPNELWNAVIRNNGPEHDREYLCAMCFGNAVAAKLREQGEMIEVLRRHCEIERETFEDDQREIAALKSTIGQMMTREVELRRWKTGDWCTECNAPQWVNGAGEHECMTLNQLHYNLTVRSKELHIALDAVKILSVALGKKI